MNSPGAVRIVPLAGHAGLAHGRFGADDAYVEALWLPVLGPASFVLWRQLARDASEHPGLTVSLDQLAASVGLGSPRGTQSALARTMRRLERFGLLRRCGDDLLVVRCRVAFVSGRQLDRLHPTIRARHDLFHSRRAAG